MVYVADYKKDRSRRQKKFTALQVSRRIWVTDYQWTFTLSFEFVQAASNFKCLQQESPLQLEANAFDIRRM